MKYVKGNLITLALQEEFDVITHGCNCFCRMGSGIAVQMAKVFNCHMFPKELVPMDSSVLGDYNKLGQIDFKPFYIVDGKPTEATMVDTEHGRRPLWVVNSYTQYAPGQATPPYDIPLDYDALRMCFRKINFRFRGKDLGIPMIGSALARGDWDTIEQIVKEESTNMNVTVVEYDGTA